MQDYLKDPRYLAAELPTYVLAGLVFVARQRGFACESWFAGLGLSPEASFDASVRVSQRQMATVIRRAVQAHPGCELGLAVGSEASMSSFGVLGLAVMSCRTLEDALRLACEYHRVSGGLAEPVFSICEDEVHITAHQPFREQATEPFVCEELLACMYVVALALTQGEFRLRRVELAYAPPPYAAAYRRRFACPVRFNADSTRMVVDRQWLSYRIATHNPITLSHAVRLCQEQLRSIAPMEDTAAALMRWLRVRLQSPVDMSAAAQALNLSERTLRRRLSDQGRSFRSLHEQVRKDVGIELLREGLAIADIALRTGFRDGREFRRAFKRWTGQTPTDYRNSLREA